jgi:hypothetical protein
LNSVQIHLSAEETATGNSGAIAITGRDKLGISVDLSAITAGSLDVTVEWSPDGSNFGDADTTPDALTQFLQAGGATVLSKSFDVKAPYFRVVWTIVTGPATFAITGIN